jgi:hypothetical protein
MKSLRSILILVLLATLALSLTTCGGSSDDTKAPEPIATIDAEAPSAPTKTPPPTNTPLPTDTPEPEPVVEGVELDTSTLSQPSDLSSYRSKMNIFMEGMDEGQEVQGTIEFLVEYTSEPLAQRIVISGEGFGETEEAGSIEMYRVEDTAYMKFGEEWISMPVTEDDPLSEAGMINPDDMLEDTCGWKKQKDTEYNGVKVEHWTVSKKEMEACMTAEQLAEIGEITDASGKLYVAKDDNYIAYMELIFEGNGLGMSLGTEDNAVDEGRMEFTFEMLDVNQPFTIELPEEALASGAMPEDIPIPDDAEEVSNMLGMISFTSPSATADIADFYKAEMPNNGWTEVSAEEFSGMFMLEYTKESRTASIMINTDSESDKTSVLITVEESEG